MKQQDRYLENAACKQMPKTYKLSCISHSFSASSVAKMLCFYIDTA